MIRALSVCALLLAAGSASAAVHIEVGDAGELPGTAQAADGGFGVLDGIAGSVTGADADMYIIDIKDPTTFSAAAFGIGGDTTLYLFNLDGTGIAKDDDSGTGFLSLMAAGNALYAGLAPGQYLLAIGGFAYQPFRAAPVTFADAIFDPNNFGTVGPQVTDPVAGWIQLDPPGTSGAYEIVLTGASFVPTPGAAALLGLGALAAGRRRRA